MPERDPDPHSEARVFFDRIADDYRRRSETAVYNVSSLSFRRRQDVVSGCLAEVPTGGTVLDYGMGPAVFGPPSVERGLRYIGVDISPKMIELARAMGLPGAEFHEGDLAVLEKFRETADAVLLIGLIDYLADPADGLRKLARCVKPGGRIILSFRNHFSLPRLLRNASKAAWRAIKGRGGAPETTAFEAPVLENSFSPGRDLIPVLRGEGFRKFEVRYLDCSPVFFNLPLGKPLWEFGRRFDAAVASPLTAPLCASGVLIGSDKG
jgi:SAM-dependent methyltransferase